MRAFVGVAWLLLALAPRAAVAQYEIEIELPDPTFFGPDAPDEIRHRIGPLLAERVATDRPGEDSRPAGIAVIDLGDLSSNNPAFLVSGWIRIRVYSPSGFFPPYRIEARALSGPVPGPGNLVPSDVGVGVIDVEAQRPRIDPDFDSDPRTAPKNVDDEPIFVGTVASLGTGFPRSRLYQTRGWYVGNYNYFTIVFAVGPQFYTPAGTQDLGVELAIVLG
ncbi:MAG: hypothetical protein R3B81_05745 [bacterium]